MTRGIGTTLLDLGQSPGSCEVGRGLFGSTMDELMKVQLGYHREWVRNPSIYSAVYRELMANLHKLSIGREGVSEREVEQAIAAQLVSYIMSFPIPIVDEGRQIPLEKQVFSVLTDVDMFVTFLRKRNEIKPDLIWSPLYNRGAIIIATSVLPPIDLVNEYDEGPQGQLEYRQWTTALPHVLYQESGPKSCIIDGKFVLPLNTEIRHKYVLNRDVIPEAAPI